MAGKTFLNKESVDDFEGFDGMRIGWGEGAGACASTTGAFTTNSTGVCGFADGVGTSACAPLKRRGGKHNAK